MNGRNKPRSDHYIAAGADHRTRERETDLSTIARPFPVGFEVMPTGVAQEIVDGLTLHAGLLYGELALEVVAALAVLTRGLPRRDAVDVIKARLATFGAPLPRCWEPLFTFHRQGATVDVA